MWVALITFSINHCGIVRQKEFSRKTENNKIKSFHGMNSAVITLVLNRSRIFYSTLFAFFWGILLSCKMNRNIMVKVQK